MIFHLPGDRKYIVEDSPETPCIRASREQLRTILSTGVDVQWGKKVGRVEEVDDKVLIHFEDGTSASGDLLVGADGTHSSSQSIVQ